MAPVAEAAPEPATPEPTPVVESAPATAEAPESTSAVSMLDMAQRLHDEYMQDGQKKGEEIIADARVEADRIIAEAEQEHSRVLAQLEHCLLYTSPSPRD